MKLIKMLYGLTLMLGCFVLASCVNDDEGPCLPDGKTQVVFSLVLPDNAQTRAWEEGVGVDNNIDLSSIKLLIYDDAGNCMGVLTTANMVCIPRETGTTPYEKTVYDCIGTVPSEIKDNLKADTEYRFVVLANCTVDIDNPSWSALSDVDFPRTQESMPMWGFQSGTLTLNPGESMPLGTITLLRAKAKVTVKLGADSTDDTSTSGDTTGEAVDKLDGFTYIKSVQVLNYSDNGFIVPVVTATVTATPENLAVSRTGYTKGTSVFKVEGSASTNELTFYLLEYKNSTAAEADQAQLIVTLGKTVTNADTGEEQEVLKEFDFAPIKFCTYDKNTGAPSGAPFDIVRNHHYKFNITEVVGGLYVKPTVADWNDGPSITYTINMSTNIRLFDSWLYRYDTDNDYKNWNESYMVVSTGHDAPGTEGDYGRPVHSPMIQLVTTGGPFELKIDNEDFKIVSVTKDDEAGTITGYPTHAQSLVIPAAAENKEVYTYFYIVPTSNTTGKKAHVFLYYNDPVLGNQEVPFNSSALPGYSDDSSEFWVYSVTEAQYNDGKIGDNNPFLRMYYYDAQHPLVDKDPTPNP